jgi:hypothetical protein
MFIDAASATINAADVRSSPVVPAAAATATGMSMLAIAVFEKNVPKPNVANPRTASVVNRLSSSAVTCRL